MIKKEKISDYKLITTFFIKLRYLFTLKKHKLVINSLDMNNKINAIINEFVTEQIFELISNKINSQDKKAIKMMKEEIIRIEALTNNYKYGFIEPMTYEEMKSIINYYVDDLWTEKKIDQKLKKLFNNNKIKVKNYHNNIIKFNKK